MSEEKKVEPFYIRQAREMLDALITWKVVNAEACTDPMKEVIADYIGFVTQSMVESAIKGHELVRRMENRKGQASCDHAFARQVHFYVDGYRYVVCRSCKMIIDGPPGWND